MDKTEFDKYQLTEKTEKELWENAIIVFDSSSLLDLYFVPKIGRDNIYSEVFEKLENRLWLPNHVKFEFLKNREKSLKKPISEKYEPLKKSIKSFAAKTQSDFIKKIEEIQRATIKSDKHPHIRQDELDDFKKKSEAFLNEVKSFEKSITKQISIAETEILDVTNKDDVSSAIDKFFKIGREYSFDEIIEITKEGKHRYEFKIPPGYGDYYKKEKKGIQIFADLIIWKQILEYSAEKKKPIILITNDIKKDEDWCYLDRKATEDRIAAPREELIKEINDHSNSAFWMYNLPQFLFNGNKYLQSNVPDQTIQNLTQFLNTKSKKPQYLRFKCENCHRVHTYDKSEIDLDFDCVGGSERSMGTENQYVSEVHFKCQCGNDINANFEVWEYPVGIHNYDDLTLEGAELIDSFSFTIDFFEEERDEPDYSTCHICEGNKDGMGNIVSFWNDIDLINEYPRDHPNSKYQKTVSGSCDWCNSLHIRCPKCDAVNLVDDPAENENIECDGGCGLIFFKDTSNDLENLGEEFDLKLIDPRVEKCSKCGEDFIDENGTGLCDDCEEEYNQK